MLVGTFFNIPSDNVDNKEDEEEETNPNKNQEIKEETVLHFVVPDNIIPPNNLDNSVNVMVLLNALYDHYQYKQ